MILLLLWHRGEVFNLLWSWWWYDVMMWWCSDVVSSCDDNKYYMNVKSDSSLLLLIKPCTCSQYPADQTQQRWLVNSPVYMGQWCWANVMPLVSNNGLRTRGIRDRWDLLALQYVIHMSQPGIHHHPLQGVGPHPSTVWRHCLGDFLRSVYIKEDSGTSH